MEKIFKVVGLHHVQLAIPPNSEEEARAFYSDILGLAEVSPPTTAIASRSIWFENERVRIHLGIETDFRPASKAHPALLIDNFKQILVTLRAAGLEFSKAESMDGCSRGHIHDPFGNRIELIQA